MLRLLLLIVGWIFSVQIFAQTGIGTTSPDPSAKLEVKSDNKGFLPPRVTLTSTSDATTIPSPATGLLVYNTGNNAGLRAGYYYWNGTDWTTIATPISAQTVDYVSVLSTSDQTVNTNDIVKFNSIYSGNIPYDASTGKFSLTAGKTYRLNASVSLSNGNVNAAEVSVGWKNAAGDLLGNKAEVISASYNTNIGGNSIVEIVYTPLTNTTVSLDVIYASSNAILWNRFTYANIQQIGSSAIINPWILSGTNTYNTTGNVGIGTNAPTAKLQVNGNSIIGNGTSNLQIGSWAGGGNYAAIANSNVFSNSNSYALLQSNTGETYINSASGQPLHLKVGNGSEAIVVNSSSNVGIGTINPTSKLNINGGGVKINSGLGNTANRPSLNTSDIGNYEIRGVGGGSTQNDTQDDGFLRLSAGGGTNVNTQSSIDITGYSTVSDMSSNIVMRTNGTERLRIDNSGNVNVTGKLNVTDPTGSVATKAASFVNAGTFVTLDNIKATVSTSGNSRGLCIATVSGNIVAYMSGTYGATGGVGGGALNTSFSFNTSLSSPIFGWYFGNVGDSPVYLMNDTTNNRFYRITLMIGWGFNNNFICIERLL